jgi:hypothetical protein
VRPQRLLTYSSFSIAAPLDNWLQASQSATVKQRHPYWQILLRYEKETRSYARQSQ